MLRSLIHIDKANKCKVQYYNTIHSYVMLILMKYVHSPPLQSRAAVFASMYGIITFAYVFCCLFSPFLRLYNIPPNLPSPILLWQNFPAHTHLEILSNSICYFGFLSIFICFLFHIHIPFLSLQFDIHSPYQLFY
jgi:Na+/melibiose symporter-like transporter